MQPTREKKITGAELHEFGTLIASRDLKPCPITTDLRGNALSIQSYKHIHHPLRSALLWARIVEKLLEKTMYGLRKSLVPSVELEVTKTAKMFMRLDCEVTKTAKLPALQEVAQPKSLRARPADSSIYLLMHC